MALLVKVSFVGKMIHIHDWEKMCVDILDPEKMGVGYSGFAFALFDNLVLTDWNKLCLFDLGTEGCADKLVVDF